MIVGKNIIRVSGNNSFKGINCVIIISPFLVGKAEIIVDVRAFGRNVLGLMEDFYRIIVAFEAAENCTKAYHRVGIIRL